MVTTQPRRGKPPMMRCVLPIPNGVRKWLLKTYSRGTQQDHYCFWVTWLYGFRDGETFEAPPTGKVEVLVTGLFRTDDVDLLLCTVNGEDRRPDGAPFHITLTARQGFQPRDAWRKIRDDLVVPIRGTRPFTQEFQTRRAMRDMPKALAA